MKKHTCLSAAFVAFAVLANFAGLGLPTQATAAGDDTYQITLGYYNCDHMTAAPVAEMGGIYKRMGLNVRGLGNAKVPESMAAGHMDVGYVGIGRVMRGFVLGAPLKVTANNHLGGSEYFVVKENINSAQDLKGKKVMLGANPDKTNGNWINYAIEQKIPVNPKEFDIEVFAMSDKDAYLALKAGHLDAMDSCDPWGSMAMYEKTGKILTTFTGLRNQERGTCCVLTMNTKFLKEHPDLAVKMLQAHAEAIKTMYLEPKRASVYFAKAYSVPEEVALMTLFQKTVNEGRTMSWVLDDARVQATRDNNLEIGILDQNLEIADFVDHTYIDKAGLPDFDEFIKKEVDPIFPVGMPYADWRAKVMERNL